MLLSLVVGCARGPIVVGESVRGRDGDPVRSTFFDGERVRLRGVRGEVLGVEVLKVARARLSLPAEAARVQPFAVRGLTVHTRSSKAYGPNRGRGVYPDILDPDGADPTFFDVAIAPTARPGRYAGTLEADGRRFPVELTVEPITIDLSRDPLVWVFYLPKEIARVHGVPDDDGPAELEWERRYHALFRAHGAYLASDLPPARFPPRRALVDGVRFWPVALDVRDDDHLASDVRQFDRLFRGLTAQPFAIPVDEPHGHDAFVRVHHICDAVAHNRDATASNKLLCTVTHAPEPEMLGPVDVFLDGRRGGWTYNGGRDGGAMTLDAPGPALRSWGWIAFRDDLQLWYAWEGLYFSDRYNGRGPTDVFHDPLTFDHRAHDDDRGNSDGLLAYPGPLPSLRLKTLRRGLEDRLLLEKLAACGGRAEAEALARRVVPDGGGWPVDEARWEAARGQLLDAILRRCPHES